MSGDAERRDREVSGRGSGAGRRGGSSAPFGHREATRRCATRGSTGSSRRPRRCCRCRSGTSRAVASGRADRRHHDLPGARGGPASREPARTGGRRRGARCPRARPPLVHDRSASQRRRRGLRRWAGHGDEARAAVRGGRVAGGRPRQGAGDVAGRQALGPGARPRARSRTASHLPLWPLRGVRRAGDRRPACRGALDRRLRGLGGRAPGARGDRGRDQARPRCHRQRGLPSQRFLRRDGAARSSALHAPTAVPGDGCPCRS